MRANLQNQSAFQSTPPLRVATYLNEEAKKYIDISIHATLAGGDVVQLIQQILCLMIFQSTPPLRVATKE